MKRFAKMTALAVSLVTLLFSACTNISSDDAGYVSSDTSSGNSESRQLTLNVSSNSNLVDFSSNSTSYDTTSGSRTILPEAQQVGNLWFYLCAKNNTSGAASFAAPVAVTVIPTDDSGAEDATATTSRTGHVVISLTKADYDFELFAVPKATGATAAPTYSSESDVKAVAVLVGYANADIRNDDAVDFYLNSEGLTTVGNVSLKLYTDGWSLSTAPYDSYTPSAKITFTKAGRINTTDYAEGATYPSTLKPASADESLTIPTSAPASANYTATGILPGTYNFEVLFTNGSTSYTWSDRIIILPGQTTEATIAIPSVIETPPSAPADFKAAYIDPTNDSNQYYTAEFVWDQSAINNEEKFEIELMKLTTATDYSYINSYAGVIEGGTSTQEQKDTAWSTLLAQEKSSVRWGTTKVAATTSEPAYEIFYGSPKVWVAGSLQKNNEMAQFRLLLGSRYVARIRAVNAAGGSPWVYAVYDDIAADPDSGAVAAKAYTSKTLNRYRVTYDLNGGTLVDGAATPATITDTVFYYCQEITVNSGSGSSPTFTGGNSVMQPDGSADFDATASDRNVTITKPKLTNGTRTWTNWLNNNANYNEVGVAPAAYNGFDSLYLVANYATIGNVTIFDDSAYALFTIATASSGSGTPAAAFSGTYPTQKITVSQTGDVTLTWTVTYPTGVVYDKVSLTLTSTDGRRSYVIGNIKNVSTSDAGVTTGTFTIPVSEYTKGYYNAVISAYTSVKPNDPYTANITMTITD